MKVSEFKDRLKQAMDANGVRATDLCEATLLPKSTVSEYLKGIAVPKADRLYTISKYFRVSEAWLLGYDVPMNETDGIEEIRTEVLRELNDLSPEQLSAVLALVRTLRK